MIELLIVIAIIAILAVVVFVALNPLERFQDARDAQRWTDITAIREAVNVNLVDNNGTLLPAVSGLTDDSYYVVGTCASGADATCTAKTTQAACVDLAGLVTDGQLSSIPFDPSTGDSANTDYYIMIDANNSIAVGACDPEGGSAVSIAY